MNRSLQTLAAALTLALLVPTAWAGENDHATHQKAGAAEKQGVPHDQMNHGQMDHSQMPGMDHSQMKNMDHSKMDHGAMHKDAKPKAENSDDR
ncbi:hypothetical protein Pres01_38810 [Metapseudomonas resinovorans]|uniref:hypothetical protein n=1 Tax=Metapseudomonas resinovorans TaxID=53412 RepID=UPI000984B863|nr:hypothetical protein [Pseudomonas resinovorans]GLZ87830.1 hypothetical protein Pres01_38810 [Pseudomonas resinovorans]